MVDLGTRTSAELDTAKEIAKEDFVEIMFLSGSNSQKYYKLRDDLSKDYAKNADNYPNMVDGMMCLLNSYKIPAGYCGGNNRQQVEGGLAFY